ncbi:MAG: undecaprenyl/decaprenyl-phosphate alpha-N-acetylglucosaminyl 1-phosphate transferase [Planctomycetes bacterium]|nr:undecaprenyl/decaprenyl-phosphate alpha-N-acetylglucosaminyl 1-phosphate transferase [Planctomycetota bacterium]
MTTYLCVYLGSLLLALVATLAVIRLAGRIGAVDRPGIRTVHERPTPRIGGIAIFIAAMALIIAVPLVNNNIGAAFRASRLQVGALLASATLIFLVGLLDDLKGLPARVKFLAELLMALGLCLVGVRISQIGLTEGSLLQLGGWGYLVTVLWIVGVTNAVNLSDGLDGLAAGVCAIACGVIAIFALHSGQVIMGVFMLALLGSLSGFLFFNFNPAKVFMGDCGSLFLGFTLAAASVMCTTKSATIVGLALPALALGIPIFDTLFCMLRRFLERRSMFAPDRSHFHHKLLDLGLQQRHAVIVIYLATLTATGMGLFMLVSQSISSLIVFGCVLVLILLLFRVVGAVYLGGTIRRLRDKYAYACCEREERKTFEHLQLRFRQVGTFEQWWEAVCEAATGMDFAWVALKTTHGDGRVEEEIWRAAETPPDLSRIVTMTIPLSNGRAGMSPQFEVAIYANGSVESAARRASLFGRLLDESERRVAAGELCRP